MAEMILPGVYIETRAEGLIVPGRVTVGNVGVVGTASKGILNEPTLLSTYAEAQQQFGRYDSFYDDDELKNPRADSLTLVRALEQVFGNGATTVFAVRIAGSGATAASSVLVKDPDKCVTLTAKSEGVWGNNLEVNVAALATSDPSPFVDAESVDPTAPKLKHLPTQSARNRVTYKSSANGVTTTFSGSDIVYSGAPTAGHIKIDPATGDIAPPPGTTLVAADKLTASYAAAKDGGVKVTLRLGTSEEVFIVVSGDDLADDINDVDNPSAWVKATSASAQHPAHAGLPDKSVPPGAFSAFGGGKNGEAGANYSAGLEALLNEDVQIIVAAGQDDSFAGELHKHCQKASGDLIKRDRIAVVGSALKGGQSTDTFLDKLRGHNVASDRVIFVAPGIKAFDTALTPPKTVTLPGAYAAAAAAGLLASYSAHISLTNKTIGVDGVEEKFNSAQLTQLVQNRVLALEERRGFRIVKGITTDDGAFTQITTRRIVDFAKFGVRSAASPYIGLLNNDRVRGALRATVNSFLTEMVEDEMLVSYDLAVTATRDEEKKGIAKVTIVLRPTFSIDFIKVTMILE
ncbi:MAG TPA: phage tail sheath subtilisin-like domain-containing protein [Blastocatellia bacterium]|nr:phage tail sheath subtilisin-like domain-containing protein [Blastocatellia bacterium]